MMIMLNSRCLIKRLNEKLFDVLHVNFEISWKLDC